MSPSEAAKVLEETGFRIGRDVLRADHPRAAEIAEAAAVVTRCRAAGLSDPEPAAPAPRPAVAPPRPLLAEPSSEPEVP